MKNTNRLGVFIIVLSIPFLVYGAVAKYNYFPALKPSHVLDEKLTSISFAFSMRVLESDYNGPLVRLRRDSDNAVQDFGWGDNDIVDTAAIGTWRGTSNVYVHTWYDQSGLGRNAVQTSRNRQPRFFPDANNPHFQGDGNNDHLTVDTPNGIQDVTNNGDEGTVLTVMRATKKSQHTFGVLSTTVSPSDRWSSHVNWNNNNLYFDPGICCDTNRFFENSANVGNWVHYTFVKTNTHIIMRSDTIDRLNAIRTNGVCTLTTDFAIGWATGNETGHHATTSFLEFIMYKTDISATQYKDIEENSMTFWGL